jgi:mRNA-degrading endonuclease RelE of RelBE toxin-antitoxin system
MNKLDKALSKIDKNYRIKILETLILIKNKNIKGLDIKKLKGLSSLYRVMVGEYRIQFKIEKEDIFILDISKRNDNTYKNIP